MTVNDWIDAHMNLIKGRRIRIIDSGKGNISDMLMLYMDRPVKGFKVTSKFLFIFI